MLVFVFVMCLASVASGRESQIREKSKYFGLLVKNVVFVNLGDNRRRYSTVFSFQYLAKRFNG